MFAQALLLAAAVSLTVPAPKPAHGKPDSYDNVPPLSVGMEKCSAWNSDLKSHSKKFDEKKAWVLGYYTGSNSFRGTRPLGYFFFYDEDHIVEYVTRMCAYHPDWRIGYAALDLIRGLEKSGRDILARGGQLGHTK